MAPSRSCFPDDLRRRPSARPIWLVSLVGWLVAASWCFADAPPKLHRDWHEMRTPHFILWGDASERQMQDVARSLESLRAFLGQIVGAPDTDPVPTYVYVFRNQRSFRPYEPRRLDGEQADVAGFFISHPQANYVVVDGSRQEALVDIAQHEYVHFIVEHHLPAVPLWFNEGLAEFYSTFEAHDDRAYLGKTIDRHLFWLKRNSLIPLIDFFSVTHWSPEYHDEWSRRGVFYAQSWLIVHYLFLEADGGMQQLVDFLELQKTMPIPAAFERAFGMEPAAMERRLRRHLSSRTFSFRRVELPAASREGDRPMRPLPEAEALARLGELLAAQGLTRFQDGEAHARAALAKDSELVSGHVTLGLLQLSAGRFADTDAMVGHFQTARRLAPDDRMIAFLLAWARARRGDPGAALRDDVTRVVNADPRFRDGWRLLAWSWADASERLDEATRVFEGAHRMLPDDVVYAEHLHRLYRATGRIEDANGLMESFFAPRNLQPASQPATPPLP